ncbi:hypothetical protein F8388_012296 [Cannabis sativa]|uniref:Uncharacterized protein n=1 Tax=Cannabis sativa TaxID=3483 RepID=A0A7J6ECN7_CANSA|nr:hypothetical protein F8388_012296 [Cannabis sativa]
MFGKLTRLEEQPSLPAPALHLLPSINQFSGFSSLGPTMLSTTVHAMSILLEISKWDWFINLNASDYPLVSQGGMVSVGAFFVFKKQQWKRKNERESRGEDMMQAMLNPFS